MEVVVGRLGSSVPVPAALEAESLGLDQERLSLGLDQEAESLRLDQEAESLGQDQEQLSLGLDQELEESCHSFLDHFFSSFCSSSCCLILSTADSCSDPSLRRSSCCRTCTIVL